MKTQQSEKKTKRKLIPSKNSSDKDKIYTPISLCIAIIKHFLPNGVTCLEPAKGPGNFITASTLAHKAVAWNWCEIDEGRDFFNYKNKVDWTVTNPPYSIFRKFLIHSMEVADNIVFLCPINHIMGLKARLRDIKEHGFYVREIAQVEKPKEWPSSGFAYAAILLNKEKGNIKMSELYYEQ